MTAINSNRAIRGPVTGDCRASSGWQGRETGRRHREQPLGRRGRRDRAVERQSRTYAQYRDYLI